MTEQGVVKWYSEEKGYGFIMLENGVDIFVHNSGIINGGPLSEGDKVAFELVKGPKGLTAKNVVRGG